MASSLGQNDSLPRWPKSDQLCPILSPLVTGTITSALSAQDTRYCPNKRGHDSDNTSKLIYPKGNRTPAYRTRDQSHIHVLPLVSFICRLGHQVLITSSASTKSNRAYLGWTPRISHRELREHFTENQWNPWEAPLGSQVGVALSSAPRRRPPADYQTPRVTASCQRLVKKEGRYLPGRVTAPLIVKKQVLSCDSDRKIQVEFVRD